MAGASSPSESSDSSRRSRSATCRRSSSSRSSSGQFERLSRGFQDAVAAHDLEALAATARAEERASSTSSTAARDAVDPARPPSCAPPLEDYYAAGYDVSRRLIAGETGERLRRRRSRPCRQSRRASAALIKRAAALDRDELTAAFAAATRAEAAAQSYRLWISVACLVAVLLLSLALSRGLLRSVAELTAGFARFGGGDFASPSA